MEILRALGKLESANLSEIAEKTSIEQATLKRAVCFLEEQELIKKENIENESVYKITPRGERVTQYFSEQSQEASQEELDFQAS